MASLPRGAGPESILSSWVALQICFFAWVEPKKIDSIADIAHWLGIHPELPTEISGQMGPPAQQMGRDTGWDVCFVAASSANVVSTI